MIKKILLAVTAIFFGITFTFAQDLDKIWQVDITVNASEESLLSFPETLEEWIAPSWEKFDLRKNPLTPWLKPYMIDTIQNFETVLNGYYPTVSDFRIKGYKKSLLKLVSGYRFKYGWYKFPYEIKLLHKIWKYRQPEIEGFYSE